MHIGFKVCFHGMRDVAQVHVGHPGRHGTSPEALVAALSESEAFGVQLPYENQGLKAG